MGRLLTAVSYLVVAFLLLIVVLHFVFGFQYVVILTDSMEPHINPGDLVVTKPVPPSELRVGDVILYELRVGNSTYLIVHRIVAVHNESGGLYFITKGDNRRYPDPWRVYPEQVKGRVVLVIPKVGLLWPYLPLIVLFLFLLVIGSIAYEIALILMEREPRRPKWANPYLLAIRRKRLKKHYRR